MLKCLGAGATRITTVYLLQIMTLGLIGSFFGVFLAQCGLWLARWKFIDALPAKMSYTVSFSSSWQGMMLGVLISLLFSALPLLQIRTIKPKLLLRDENNLSISRLDWTKWGFGAICLAGLLGLAIWQAGSVTVGAFFLGGLAVTRDDSFDAGNVAGRGGPRRERRGGRRGERDEAREREADESAHRMAFYHAV